MALLSALRLAVAACRSAAAYAGVSLYVAIVGPPALLLAVLFNWPNVLYQLGALGVHLGLALTGIRYHVLGLEHLQRHRPAIYCFNHVSNVDGPVVFVSLRPLFPRLRALYKAELRGLPILNRVLNVAGFVPVDRGNKEQTTAAVDRATLAMREGYSFLIAPEGTRSRSGELLPFKKGGFIMAINAQAPMVPMAVEGARAAMRKGSPIIWPVRTCVRMGPPVETAGLTLDDRDRLMEQVRQRIVALLGQDSDSASGQVPS